VKAALFLVRCIPRFAVVGPVELSAAVAKRRARIHNVLKRQDSCFRGCKRILVLEETCHLFGDSTIPC
jgi:hypothetical protein